MEEGKGKTLQKMENTVTTGSLTSSPPSLTLSPCVLVPLQLWSLITANFSFGNGMKTTDLDKSIGLGLRSRVRTGLAASPSLSPREAQCVY